MIVVFISTKCVYYLRIMNSEKLVVVVLYHSINRYLHEISEMYLYINSVTQTRLESIIISHPAIPFLTVSLHVNSWPLIIFLYYFVK